MMLSGLDDLIKDHLQVGIGGNRFENGVSLTRRQFKRKGVLHVLDRTFVIRRAACRILYCPRSLSRPQFRTIPADPDGFESAQFTVAFNEGCKLLRPRGAYVEAGSEFVYRRAAEHPKQRCVRE